MPAIAFVQRQINDRGSIYWNAASDMAGVGAHSRVRPAAPGKLIVREPNGTLRTLVDGSAPSSASLNLIDVSGFDVSYDGTEIVFAGLPNGNYANAPAQNTRAWRLYRIGVDGRNLRQVTTSDLSISYTQFGPAASGGLQGYDDYDPSWLPDGRIVFSSTRWPSYGQYSGVRASNLYVVNADGSGIHRITAERNGADRPQIDPITGKIVFSRWWRNHRFPIDDMSTLADPNGGFIRKDGLGTDRQVQMDGSPQWADIGWRNSWHIAAINPDGNGLVRWQVDGTDNGSHHSDAYGGAFDPSGRFYSNFFPMGNMTEAGGFGGIRRFERGPDGGYVPIIGVTSLSGIYANASNPTSFGIFQGNYASEPEVLPDNRLLISWAAGIGQDYGLYIVNENGTGRALLYDNPGTQELRGRAVLARARPPVIADTVTQVPSLLPPAASGPYDTDGTFTFDALNVYGNAPVDSDIVSAPAVGSAARIRFFIDHQRTSPGSFPAQDWPILLDDQPIAADGSVRVTNAPANVPLFEQLRDRANRVPFTGGHVRDGVAQVTGMNYGRPGSVARCVGCHAGHTLIPVPTSDAEAKLTNLAPGAQVFVSSTRDANQNRGVIDRKVRKGEIWRYWMSAPGQRANQWVRLVFDVPVSVREVKLYNPRPGDEANSTIQVSSATVQVCADADCATVAASGDVGNVSVDGTSATFAPTRARAVRVLLNQVSGTFYGAQVAGLAEVEVIARGEAP